MVSAIQLKLTAETDQKKDIVALFPDVKQVNIVHSCSMDRSVSTYDLKQEKRVNWR